MKSESLKSGYYHKITFSGENAVDARLNKEATIDDLERENRALKRKLKLSEVDFESLKSKLNAEQFTVETLLRANSQLKASMANTKTQATTEKSVVSNRLGNYAKILNESRNSLLAGWQDLSDQIEISKSTHPLNDLLKYTKHELSKIEDKILSSYTDANQKSALIIQERKMREQRDYLDNLIQASASELKAQADEIRRKLGELETVSEIPPAPPLK